MNGKKIEMIRCEQNPLITTADVLPSREGFVVKGVFNCGVAKFKNEYILLCRVAEAVETDEEDVVAFPVIEEKDQKSDFKIITIRKSEHLMTQGRSQKGMMQIVMLFI